MSFILDALKKSEAERQRASGPAMFEVKVAPPRARFPTWALLVGALLGINLLVLLWVLLRQDSGSADGGPTVTSAASTPTAPAAPARPLPLPTPTPTPAPSASLPATGVADLAADGEAALAPQVNPADERPAVLPGTSEAAAAAREQAQARRAAAAEAARVREQMEATAASVMREPAPTLVAAGLPTRDELVNSGRAKIPELQLSLHAYDPNPARRFVFINGQRAHEGDAVASGVVLESITRDGVILSSGGQRFALPVQ